MDLIVEIKTCLICFDNVNENDLFTNKDKYCNCDYSKIIVHKDCFNKFNIEYNKCFICKHIDYKYYGNWLENILKWYEKALKIYTIIKTYCKCYWHIDKIDIDVRYVIKHYAITKIVLVDTHLFNLNNEIKKIFLELLWIKLENPKRNSKVKKNTLLEFKKQFYFIYNNHIDSVNHLLLY